MKWKKKETRNAIKSRKNAFKHANACSLIVMQQNDLSQKQWHGNFSGFRDKHRNLPTIGVERDRLRAIIIDVDSVLMRLNNKSWTCIQHMIFIMKWLNQKSNNEVEKQRVLANVNVERWHCCDHVLARELLSGLHVHLPENHVRILQW